MLIVGGYEMVLILASSFLYWNDHLYLEKLKRWLDDSIVKLEKKHEAIAMPRCSSHYSTQLTSPSDQL